MAAPKGHERWGNPMNHKKLTPKQVWDGACEYFEWCINNPIKKVDFKGGFATKVVIPIDRAFSIEGLCTYLNITYQTFQNYSKESGYETYFEVCSHIKRIIDAQHFELGMAGVFNANIVTRKLGLTDKKDLSNSDGTLKPTTIIVNSEAAKSAIDKIMNERG